MGYNVISSNDIYQGRTYSSFVSDWLNWFLSVDADRHNSGPVVFTRSLGISEPNGSEYLPDRTASNTYADDSYYPKPYLNDPNVKIGADRLRISKYQAVLVPIIVAFEVAKKPYYDWGLMQEFTGLTIDQGDNPPEANQLTINGNPIILPIEMQKFRIMTPVFTAVVPEADYGRSLKDFLEESVPTGHHPAIVDGYFVLMTFDPGRYLVHAWATAPRETRGPYFSELIYEIDVNDADPKTSRGGPGFKPALREGIIKGILKKKQEIGELDPTRAPDIIRQVGL